MFANVMAVAPLSYSTECAVNYNQDSIRETFKKYGIIIPKEKINKNNSVNLDHIISRENTTNMENNNIYKELEILSSDYSDVVLYLNFPISFKIEVDENGFYYISEKYNLYVYGKTQNEAESNILEEFRDQFDAFCFEEDINLDKNAQTLKKNLLEVYKYAKKKD